MMAAFNVTALPDLGYAETSFIDPMESRWRAKPITTADFTDAAIESQIKFMASLHPYDKVDEVNAALDAYWATKKVAREVTPVTAAPSTLATVNVGTSTRK